MEYIKCCFFAGGCWTVVGHVLVMVASDACTTEGTINGA